MKLESYNEDHAMSLASVQPGLLDNGTANEGDFNDYHKLFYERSLGSRVVKVAMRGTILAGAAYLAVNTMKSLRTGE